MSWERYDEWKLDNGEADTFECEDCKVDFDIGEEASSSDWVCEDCAIKRLELCDDE